LDGTFWKKISERVSWFSTLVSGIKDFGQVIVFGIAGIGAIGVYLGAIYTAVDRIPFTLLFLKSALVTLSLTTFVALCLAYFFQRLYSRRQHHLKREKQIVTNYAENEKDRTALSRHHSLCDQKLFDIFSRALREGKMSELLLRKAIRTVNEDIARTIDYVCSILERLSNSRCAVYVKIVDSPRNVSNFYLRDLHIRLLRADSFSAEHDDDLDASAEHITSNSAYEKIFTAVNEQFPNQIYANDDLINDEQYTNEQPNWSQKYNAKVVCGIRNFHKMAKIRWSGILWVDNKNGKLDNDLVREHVKDVGWRLAIMLYRLEVLQDELSKELRQQKAISSGTAS